MFTTSHSTVSREVVTPELSVEQPSSHSAGTSEVKTIEPRGDVSTGAAVLRAVGTLLAFGLALIGQRLLTARPFEVNSEAGISGLMDIYIGLALSLGAATLSGFMAPKLEWSWRSTQSSPHGSYSLFRGGRLWLRCAIYASLLVSIGLCRYSNLVHLATYSDPSLPAKYSWWLSIVACIVALTLTRFFERVKPGHEMSPRFSGWNYLVFAAITIGAAIIRLYDIVDTPTRFNGDNMEAMSFAARDLSPSSWIVPGLGVYGIPALGLIFLKMSAWATAPDIFGTRLPEAVLGTLMVAGSYLLVWRSFDSHRLAAVSAGLLAVHAGHIHFSRHIMNLDPWTFVVLGFLFLTHGVRSRRAWAMGAAGMTLSFGLHLYLAVRVMLVVLPVFALYLLRHRRTAITRFIDGWILFVVGAVVVIGPNLMDMYIWKDIWEQSNRSGSSFLNIQTLHDSAKAHNLPTLVSFFEFQARRVLLIPQVLRDTSSQITIDRPLFDLWIAPFLWLGLGSAIASWRRSPSMVLNLLVCGIIMVVGQMLFNNIPYWPKLIYFMFAGCLWAAMGMLGVCQATADLVTAGARLSGRARFNIQRFGRPILYVAFAGFIALVGQRQWEAYAISARRDASPPDFAGRFIYNLPKNAVACSVKDGHGVSVDMFELKFYAQGRQLKELAPRPAAEVADQCGQRPFGWIISPAQVDLKEKLLQLYPDGKLTSYTHRYGQHLLWTFYVP